MVTTISSHDTMKAKTAAVATPVRMLGRMTSIIVRSGVAPRLRAACSSRASSMDSDVVTAMIT